MRAFTFPQPHFEKPALLELIEELPGVRVGSGGHHLPRSESVQEVEQAWRESHDARSASERVGEDREASWHFRACCEDLRGFAFEHGAHVEPAPAQAHTEGAALRIEVRDQDPASPPVLRSDADLTQVGGRGLQLVDTLADRWGWSEEDQGKVVWFELDA